MSENSFGKVFRFTTFGESHGQAMGVIVDSVPPGLEICEEDFNRELRRRRPGQSGLTTPRNEEDRARILSGVFEGLTTGAPLAVIIDNKDHVSQQYDNIKDVFRPGHADFTYFHKYGVYDYRGGGRASARETACRVAAGVVARKIIALCGTSVTAATVRVKDICARSWVPSEIENNRLRCADPEAAPLMEKLVLETKEKGDSVGGVIECRVSGCPVGLGAPVYGKLSAELGFAMLSIPASRGVEFGDGADMLSRTGSKNNDQMDENGFLTNRTGGMLGGISTGEEIVFRVMFKPTSSVSVPQNTQAKDGRAARLEIDGRHDPCVLPRAVPVVEAMTAVVLADQLMRNEAVQFVRRARGGL